MAPWRPTAAGVELAVRLTPRGGRAGIDGIAEVEGRTLLRVRVAAPPVGYAANAALVACLAEALGIAKSDIRLIGGAGGRVKTLHQAGDDLPARLAGLVRP